jgi:Bacterial regulatory protein, arsR family
MRLKHFNIELGAQIFLASSDTSRLRILNLILTNGEMCITDLERILEFTQTKTQNQPVGLLPNQRRSVRHHQTNSTIRQPRPRHAARPNRLQNHV